MIDLVDDEDLVKEEPVKVEPVEVEKPSKNSKPANKEIPQEQVDIQSIIQSIPDAELPDSSDEKLSFFQLQQRKNQAPQTSGSIEVPVAQPNCLTGLTIVFTGVLPNIERTEAEGIAKQYGAKVPKSISGKTSLVVIGNEAGPSKVAKIKQLKVKAIDQDGFLELLRKMPVNGGSGAEAKKANLKREAEERKIIEEAEAQEKLEKESLDATVKSAQPSDPNRLARHEPRPITNDEKLWTTKYAPTSTSQLCGNKGQIAKLKTWLSNWFDNAKNKFEGGATDGSAFRACLISGPPGIGKTSAAHLIAHELGFDVLEKNASDVRSKRMLNDTLKSVLDNTSVMGFFQSKTETINGNEKKFVLIMDEVDGMSSGDHGGAGALSQFCRITSTPMILICNDKSLPKMRTFDRVTFDLPFRRPNENEVKSRIMTICYREKIKIDSSVVSALVATTNNDIRQMINLLSTVSKTQKLIGFDESKDFSKSWKKQTILKPFDITGRLLSGSIYVDVNHSLNDKIDLYFNDMDITPLMVQENYIHTQPRSCRSDKERLRLVAQAADDISCSDHVNSLIRSSEQQWSLLPFHAVMSSVRPGYWVGGNLSRRIDFAGWLGQNSKQLKYQRLLQDLQYHTKLKTSTDKKELRLEYIPLLSEKLTTAMVNHGEGGIDETIDTMDYYYLSKDDWDNILDFGVGVHKGDLILKKIPAKVKGSFTRKYNSSPHPIAIYKTGNSVNTKPRAVKVDYEDFVEDDTVKDDVEEENANEEFDPKKDKLIKQVKHNKKRQKRSK